MVNAGKPDMESKSYEVDFTAELKRVEAKLRLLQVLLPRAGGEVVDLLLRYGMKEDDAGGMALKAWRLLGKSGWDLA